MLEETPSDFTIEEGRFVRLPMRMIWTILVLWGTFVWGYFDLRAQVEDTKRATALTALTVNEDHRTLISMHDDVLKISDFVDESKRMYNRYFRDFNDPDRKK